MPKKSFNGNMSGNVRIEGTEISVDEHALHPTLIVPVHFSLERMRHHESTQTLLMNIHGELLGGPNNKTISLSHQLTHTLTISNSSELEIRLRFRLDDKGIAELEQDRKGDAQLTFQLTPMLTTLANMIMDVGQGRQVTQVAQVGAYESPNAVLSLHVPQSHWVKNILPKLNAAEYLLLELPVEGRQLAKAWNYIKEAETAYFNRHFKETLVHCRDAGKYIDATLKEKLGAASLDYKDRWGRGEKLFNHFVSLWLHEEEIPAAKDHPNSDISPLKPDVENVLFISKSLARFAESLLKTPTP